MSINLKLHGRHSTPHHTGDLSSAAPACSEWVYGKTHRGTDGETTARRRVNAGTVELEIQDGAGWLRCAGDGYFTPNEKGQR